MKALTAEGDGRRLPLLQALQQMLTAMRTLSQQRASKPAPVNPCLDLDGMTQNADMKYVFDGMAIGVLNWLNRLFQLLSDFLPLVGSRHQLWIFHWFHFFLFSF